MAWNGYRASRHDCGGEYNGFRGQRAKQTWAIGQIVNVGFVKGLVVRGRNADGSYALLQPSTFRRYAFQPYMGLYREDA